MYKHALVFLLVLLTFGCSKGGDATPLTLDQKKDLANKAGTAAVVGWLAIDKPEKATVEAVKVVVDKVRASLTGLQEGGFISALPGIQEATAKLFPDEADKAKQLAADKLAKALLEELDKLFAKHPEWKEKGDEVSAILGAFLDGSSSSIGDYLK
jgi:hypothetical protein